ncbi:MAG: hypothetical protein OEZ06_00710 [Myxococcales bacterium]|nr:hypothetical protein [Myxococcales bacterium]
MEAKFREVRRHVYLGEEFTEDLTLWRYMPFPQFCGTIMSGGVFFARVTHLQDPWEASYPTSFLNVERWTEWLGANHRQAKEHDLDPAQLATHLVHAFRENFAGRHRFLVSCWHAREDESEPFWRLYSDQRFGVAIRTTLSAFCGALSPVPGRRVNVAAVRYADLTDASAEIAENFVPILFKRRDFEHEREVRAFIYDHGDSIEDEIGTTVPADLNDLCQEILVSPFADSWFTHVVRSYCETHAITCRIRKSSLYASPAVSKPAPVKPPPKPRKSSWVLFDNEQEFDAWHEAARVAAGLPRFGVRAHTGAVSLGGGLTIYVTSPHVHPVDGRVAAVIDEAQTDPAGLKIVERSWLEAEGWFPKAETLD